jgi:hypothetical protein
MGDVGKMYGLKPVPFKQTHNKAVLPGSLDLEGVQAFCFAFGKGLFDYLVDATAAWTAVERGAQFREAVGISGDYDFDIAVFGVANPAF